MARGSRIISSEFPVHITARCINRDWFKLPIEHVWSIFEDHLYFFAKGFDVKIHSFVLMTNHFHLIATTPQANLSEAMCYLMTNVSMQISRDAGRINQTFGGPYYSSVIASNHYFSHAYKYVYRNPVEAGLCQNVIEYPYSTLAGLLGFQKLTIPVAEDTLLFRDIEGTLAWLNTGYKEEHHKEIRKAIRRDVFKLPLCRSTRKPSELEIRFS